MIRLSRINIPQTVLQPINLQYIVYKYTIWKHLLILFQKELFRSVVTRLKRKQLIAPMGSNNNLVALARKYKAISKLINH
jgi:hypothetical protein